MASRSLRVKGFGLTVEVPEPVAGRLRRLVGKSRPDEPESTVPPGGLVLEDPPPLKLIPRDPAAALGFIDDRIERRAAVSVPESSGANGSVDARIAAQPWYHTIELPNGVVTPGAFDHRELVAQYGIPDDLSGKRVLDVGSADGFWSFEFERRGADVTAVDIATTAEVDLPPAVRKLAEQRRLADPLRDGFELARDLLGSKVEMVTMSVYDLEPERLGTFDLVHAGDLLLHLHDPIRALERIASVTAGEALLSDVFDPQLSQLEAPGGGLIRYFGGWNTAGWWIPALPTFVQMVSDAGFESVDVVTTYMLAASGYSWGPWRAVVRARS